MCLHPSTSVRQGLGAVGVGLAFVATPNNDFSTLPHKSNKTHFCLAWALPGENTLFLPQRYPAKRKFALAPKLVISFLCSKVEFKSSRIIKTTSVYKVAFKSSTTRHASFVKKTSLSFRNTTLLLIVQFCNSTVDKSVALKCSKGPVTQKKILSVLRSVRQQSTSSFVLNERTSLWT